MNELFQQINQETEKSHALINTYQQFAKRELQNQADPGTNKMQIRQQAISQKNLEISSLFYTIKRKSNRIYHAHLGLLKLVLHPYPKFWQMLESSEKNARGYMGWIHHMEYFYHLILDQSRYRDKIMESEIDLNELQQGRNSVQALYQVYRHLQKCKWEQRVMQYRLENPCKDQESIRNF